MGIEAITWQKIVPLGFMFFCILFNYTILRDTKVSLPRTTHFNSFDLVLLLPLRHPMGPASSLITGRTARNEVETDLCHPCAQDVLVVTAPGSGAETIPFLKTWVNLPMAIGFTVLYAKVPP